MVELLGTRSLTNDYSRDRWSIVDGEVIATWKLDRTSDPPIVLTNLFERIEGDLLPKIEVEGSDIGRFLGIKPEFKKE